MTRSGQDSVVVITSEEDVTADLVIASNLRADYKPAQLLTAARVGLEVPTTLITNDLDAVSRFAAEHGPIVYKSFRGVPSAPNGKVATIWTQRIDPTELDESVAAHLFQAEVPKHSDARVTVVGPRVFASRINTPTGALDWRSGDWDTLTHTPIHVPATVKAAVRAYLDSFGLAFGCFDFALGDAEGGIDAHRWTFIECNPNGQWGWLPDSQAIANAFAETLLDGWFA